MRMGKAGKYISFAPAIGLAALLLAVLMCPVVGSQAYAEDPGTPGITTNGITVTIDNTVRPNVTDNIMRVNNTENTGLAPVIERDEAYFWIKGNINATDVGDYGVVVFTEDGKLKSSNPSNSDTIDSIAAKSPLSGMENKWGVIIKWNQSSVAPLTEDEVSRLMFDPVPTSDSRLILAGHTGRGHAENVDPLEDDGTGHNRVKNRDFTIQIGASANKDIAADTYSTNLWVAAYASPDEVASNIFSIKTMQEMTPEICDNTTTPNTTTRTYISSHEDAGIYIPYVILEDTRDGKKYAVTKLADGNCWMQQNLALEPGTTGLTPKNTNIGNDLGYNGTTKINGTEGAMASVTTNKIPTEFSIPTTSAFSSDSAADAKSATPESVMHTDSTPTIDRTTKIVTNDASAFPSSKGVYYSWCTVTAGTCNNYTKEYSNATNDICPKGWKIPEAINSTGLTPTSYGNLAAAYGISITGALTADMYIDASKVTDYKNLLHLVQTGVINGYPNSSESNYTSTTAGLDGTTVIRHVLFDIQGNTGALSVAYRGSSRSRRFFGMAARCVAKKED